MVTKPKKPRSKEVFIHDVAKAAGCAISTVSKALNDTGSISAKTKKNVLRIAREMGYSAHPGARFLRGRRSENIGLFYYGACTELFVNPFYACVAAGIEQVLSDQNFNLLIAGTENNQDTSEMPKFVREKSVDGLILLGRLTLPLLERLEQSGLPIVLIDNEVPGIRLDTIVSDGFSGAQRAVKHLIDKGHRRIAMLMSEIVDSSTRKRFEGYQSALAEAGLPYDERLVVRGEHGEAGGVDAMNRLIKRHREFTAIFSVNDEMAVGAMTAMKLAKLRVPEDISIIGFDDIRMARLIHPALTTIRVDQIRMGKIAASLLLEKLNPKDKDANGDGDDVPMLRVFPVELVERETVTAPRK